MSETALHARGCVESDAQISAQIYGASHRRGDVEIHFNRVEALYSEWSSPICIVSDGPYGLSGYPGDLHKARELADWYRPHIRTWTEKATPETTLWFWNSELGWATVHPILLEYGWEYRTCHIWDKGLSHVAGNANTRTLRKFPVTTEVCVQYIKPWRFRDLTMQEWLRHEWRRAGLPLCLANNACGVANAATRKYLTADHLWYFPPPAAFNKLVKYANEHGDPIGQPYFSEDGNRPITEDEWNRKRAKFNCTVGITNVWRHDHVSGSERINGERQSMRWKFKSLHGSQKPLKLIDNIVTACTETGDVVWEPFGGLCPTAICAWHSNRKCFSAEIVPEFYRAAIERLSNS